MRKKDKKSYTEDFRSKVIQYAQVHTQKDTAKKFKVSQTSVYEWLKKARYSRETTKIKGESLDKRIEKIRSYLIKKYDATHLSSKQAFDEFELNSGRDFENLLGTPKLPTLTINDVARYIVLHT